MSEALLAVMVNRNPWQPMDLAPRDGTPIQAEIPGHGADNVIAFQDGYLDSAGQDCGAWCFVTDREPPEDWTDGICWEINEDGKPSTKPVRWKHLPGVAGTVRA